MVSRAFQREDSHGAARLALRTDLGFTAETLFLAMSRSAHHVTTFSSEGHPSNTLKTLSKVPNLTENGTTVTTAPSEDLMTIRDYFSSISGP